MWRGSGWCTVLRFAEPLDGETTTGKPEKEREMALKIRVEGGGMTAHEHAQQTMRKVNRHGTPLILPSRDTAMVQTCCDMCGDIMWDTIISRHNMCDICKEKKETDRQSFLGSLMGRLSGEED
jgi:hypothetical protein